MGVCIVGWVLVARAGLIDRARPRLAEVAESVRTIMRVGVPAVLTNALGPLAITLLTGIVAAQGPAALAAWGTGARVDALAMIAPVALSGALSPFVGQNWGAHLRKRVAEGIRGAVLFALGWGVAAATLLVIAARPVAELFADDPAVQDALVVYLRTMPVGYAFLASVGVASSVFNAVDHAVRSTWLSALRSLVLAVPAAWIGARYGGLAGLCLGMVIASAVAAVLGVGWMRGLLHPTGELTPATGTRVSLEDAVAGVEPAAREVVRAVLGPIVALEGVQLARVRGAFVGVFVGAREIAHLQPDGRLDLPLPFEIGDNISAFGYCAPHPEHPDDGWYTRDLRAGTAADGEWLLRLAHLLYEMSHRGPGDPVTRAELDAFTATDRCVAAMTAAATRWGLRMEQPSRALA